MSPSLSQRGHDPIAIVGVGNTPYRHLNEEVDRTRTIYSLGAQALKNALSDSGIAREEVDGLIVSGIPSYSRMCDLIGLSEPRFANVLQSEGRHAGLSLHYAAAAIQTGLASTVACVFATVDRSARASYGGSAARSAGSSSFTAPYGMTSPGAIAAHMFRRHQWDYGTPAETLGTIASTIRSHAALNPDAIMRSNFTIDDYLQARFVAEPLRILDYCLVNDGAVSVIITTKERARDLDVHPVYLAASATAAEFKPFYVVDDYWQRPLRRIVDDLKESIAIDFSSFDFVQVYDNFTPTVLFTLEGIGVCEPGEAKDWLTDERIGLAGELPVNTSGGHLSESYMHGWNLIVESVRQLRWECGERQVSNAMYGLWIAATPLTSAHVFLRDL